METAIILPPDYHPSADEEYMNELQQEYFRQKLLNWKKSLISQSQDTLEELVTQGGLNQPTRMTALRSKPTRLWNSGPATAHAS